MNRNFQIVILLLALLLACKQESKTEKQETIDTHSLLGTWTDGAGPNSTIKISEDSIFNIDLDEKVSYELSGDSITIYEDDEVFKGKVSMPHPDTLIYGDDEITMVYWRKKVAEESTEIPVDSIR